MAGVICLDFDGTIVEGDVFAAIARRFAGARGEAIYRDYRQGLLSAEQLTMRVMDVVEASEEALRDFAIQVARLRPGLLELADWAHWNDWRVAVVSNGLDLYVHPVLDSLGLEGASRHCGRARFVYRWRVSYQSPRGIEVQSGFKTSFVSAYRRAGDFVAWVGDGRSDIAPARECDAVFAREELWEALKVEHPRIYAFETFHEIVAVLEREGERWLESFSSTTAGEA